MQQLMAEDDIGPLPQDAAVPPSEEVPYDELFEAHFRGLVRLAALLGADDPEDVAQDAAVPPSEEVPYDELFEAHFRGLVRLAALLGADDPEDVAQDAFVRLHRRRRLLRDPHAALSYLRASVCNASRSRLRHLRMARRRHAQLAVPPTASGTPESAAVDREDVRELLRAVDALPRRQREVLVLRYWLDLTERETADALGIAVGTVKAHASRAVTALGKQLKDKA